MTIKKGNMLAFKHGARCNDKYPPAYSSWRGLKQRCLNANHPRYKDYGGRGIIVCDRWLNSFINFLDDMGEPPSPKHSLDRIDNNGDYTPENCRWATHQEQADNQRSNVRIIIYGVSYTVAQASRQFEIDRRKIHGRLKLGWEAHDAIFTP